MYRICIPEISLVDEPEGNKYICTDIPSHTAPNFHVTCLFQEMDRCDWQGLAAYLLMPKANIKYDRWSQDDSIMFHMTIRYSVQHIYFPCEPLELYFEVCFLLFIIPGIGIIWKVLTEIIVKLHCIHISVCIAISLSFNIRMKQ